MRMINRLCGTLQKNRAGKPIESRTLFFVSVLDEKGLLKQNLWVQNAMRVKNFFHLPHEGDLFR